jgi:hypothetical protein
MSLGLVCMVPPLYVEAHKWVEVAEESLVLQVAVEEL